MMTAKEIREKSPAELQVLLAELREKLRDTRFKVSQFQHKNYNELGEIKKDIARVKTVMKERELVQESK
jgi:large subunit ribosomal protein L29